MAFSLLCCMVRRFRALRSGVWFRRLSYSRRVSCLASSSAGVGSTRGFGVLGWGAALCVAFFRLVGFCLALGFAAVFLRGVVDFLVLPRRLGSLKVKLSTNICLLGRSIPTRVGKAAAGHRHRWTAPVHPHPRGESAFGDRWLFPSLGSPPPAWGKPHGRRWRRVVDRFTPTRVGKAAQPQPTALPRRVHPHPRGESYILPVSVSQRNGSPPPAWGKPWIVDQVDTEDRFTPTRVGKALPRCKAWRTRTVHPHPRGESRSSAAAFSSSNGSPPPAWGKPSKKSPSLSGWGFTPTRVGKAGGRTWPSGTQWVHPHPRGESPAGAVAGRTGVDLHVPSRTWKTRIPGCPGRLAGIAPEGLDGIAPEGLAGSPGRPTGIARK